MSVEALDRLRDIILPLLKPDEADTFDVWEHEEKPVYEIGLGVTCSFILKERFEGLDKTGKLDEWCLGLVERYRKPQYREIASLTRRDMVLAVYRILMELLGTLPEQWLEHALRKITMALADEVPAEALRGPTRELPLSVLMKRNRLIQEHLLSLILPKQRKEAEMKPQVA